MKPLIIANWKCNPTSLAKAKGLFNLVKRSVKKVKNVKVVICPPFVYLAHFLNSKSYILNLNFGAQDIFWEEKGAFTGEISPLMVKNLGCKYIIIGHSERRRYFNETDEMINKKIRAAISVKLKPIFCIGESQQEKKRGQTQTVLWSQISKGLKKIGKKAIKNIIIAYEPIWAIGTGKPCDIDTVFSTSLLIRKIIRKIYSSSTSKSLQILYGGSINSKNAAEYVREARMNGLLVGGASLNAEEFIGIIKAVS